MQLIDYFVTEKVILTYFMEVQVLEKVILTLVNTVKKTLLRTTALGGQHCGAGQGESSAPNTVGQVGIYSQRAD